MQNARDFYSGLFKSQEILIVGAALTAFMLWWRSKGETGTRIIVPNPVSAPVSSDGTHRKSVFGVDHEISQWDPNMTTVGHLFERGLAISPEGPVFGHRVGEGPYRWISYSSAAETIINFRMGLIKLGLNDGQDTMIGIFAKNSPQWHMSMQAVVGNKSIAVPLYLTLGDKAMHHILAETKASCVICQTESIERLVTFVNEDTNLKIVISIGQVTSEVEQKLKNLGIKIYLWDEVCMMGKDGEEHQFNTSNEDDIAVICYTSGTTGEPKGAVITHKNILGAFKTGLRSLWKYQDVLGKDDSMISYLPLAHVYGFISECIPIYAGGRIGYFRGEIKDLLSDIAELKPTIFPAVPRVLNKVYDKVNAQLETQPALLKNVFNYAVSCKLADVKAGIVRKGTIWDTLLFQKIQNKLGGKVKIIMSGSAPIQSHVMEWFKAVLGAHIIEGYGQTETTATTSVYLYGDTHTGHVGVPSPEWEIKLVDVPEMGYHVTENRGEVCVRGPGVFKGYYKQEERTREVLIDGWLHSGDIGTWTPEGRLQLIDRKKNIFKLSQGEYIAPDKIELIYERCPCVSQVFVYGESIKSTLVAIVILDEESLRVDCPPQFSHLLHLHTSEEFNNFVLSAMRKLGSTELNSIEQDCFMTDFIMKVLPQNRQIKSVIKLGAKVKKIQLYPECDAFSVENDMLTPTFKKKRHRIKQQYRDVLANLYEGMI